MHCTSSLCSQHILRIFIQEMCSLNVPFQDSKVFSISFVAISSSFIGKHCESKSDTHNTTHRKVTLVYLLEVPPQIEVPLGKIADF